MIYIDVFNLSDLADGPQLKSIRKWRNYPAMIPTIRFLPKAFAIVFVLCSLAAAFTDNTYLSEYEPQEYLIDERGDLQNLRGENNREYVINDLTKRNIIAEDEGLKDANSDDKDGELSNEEESIGEEENVTDNSENLDFENQVDDASESGSGGTSDEDADDALAKEEESGSGAHDIPGEDDGAEQNEDSNEDADPAESQSDTTEGKKSESGSGSGIVDTENLEFTAPHPNYESTVMKRGSIPHATKRQYVPLRPRPRFVVRNGYVYMKAPPMTQKTIVTTHIPRPPMVMPYNSFMNRYAGRNPVLATPGAGPIHLLQRRPSRYMVSEGQENEYEVDDERDESKVFNYRVCIFQQQYECTSAY